MACRPAARPGVAGRPRPGKARRNGTTPPVIDLRSDALSPPTAAMWRAMQRAEIGWALRGEDRSVRRLEELAAELLGKEARLLLPTRSSADLFGLLALRARG